MTTKSQHEQLVFVPAELDFNVTETKIINRIKDRLSKPDPRPLLTIDEDDQLISDQKLYFQKIVSGVITTDLDPTEIRARRQRADASARTKKAHRYSEELIKAVFAVDNCRAFLGYLRSRRFAPAVLSDNPEDLTRRVGGYVGDLLLAARQSRLIVGPPIAWACEMIVAKFGLGPQNQTELTVLVGKNQVSKARLWANHLSKVSRNWQLIDQKTIDLLKNYDHDRLQRHKAGLPLIEEVLETIAEAQNQTQHPDR